MTVALPSVLLETNNGPILILMAGVDWHFYGPIILSTLTEILGQS